jgi:hypothetical protein
MDDGGGFMVRGGGFMVRGVDSWSEGMDSWSEAVNSKRDQANCPMWCVLSHLGHVSVWPPTAAKTRIPKRDQVNCALWHVISNLLNVIQGMLGSFVASLLVNRERSSHFPGIISGRTQVCRTFRTLLHLTVLNALQQHIAPEV